MTKDEKIAYEYGKSFDISTVPEGYGVCAAFDERLDNLIKEARTEKDSKRNLKNIKSWWMGVVESNKGMTLPKTIAEMEEN